MLNKIIATKKEELLNLVPIKPTTPFTKRSFRDAIVQRSRDVALIAEVKKASPSKGVICEAFDPVEIAISYEKGGADAVSVLTDRTYFQGAPEYLTRIKEKINLPVLRKDFIIDPIQVEESKAIGADAILLIKAVLEGNQAKELYLQAKELHLDVLMEVHTRQELEDVLSLFTPDLIGINNRDLTTFETNLDQTKEIGSAVPSTIPFISESGIKTPKHVQFVHSAGAAGILVGESLMRSDSLPEGIANLLAEQSTV